MNSPIAAVQSFPIEFNINGIIVGSSSYRIEVFNDTAFDDSEFPEPIDVMTLGCNEPSCIPDLLILPRDHFAFDRGCSSSGMARYFFPLK